MNVLVSGGTVFLGRQVVDALRARGHAVTLFNRGRTRPHLFAEIEQLRGERDGQLEALAAAVRAGRRWDAVIDCCGFVPRVVQQSAELLREATDRYLFVSSISVYADFSRPGTTEDSALAQLSDPASEDVPRDYGALKAACERVVSTVFGARAINVRPGLIVGPWDPTGRFTYWVARAAQGGEMLAPKPSEAVVQVIDARDLAAWMVHAVEIRAAGEFNVTGPVGTACSFGQFVDACIAAGGADTTPHWVEGAFLLEHKVAPWTELPVWLPPEDGGLFSVDVRRAAAAGLVTRALADTIRDTLAWRTNTPDALRNERVPAAGISREREAQLLAAWQQRMSAS